MYSNQTSSYIDSGFNKFFSRSINASGSTNTLQEVSNTAGNLGLNFDQRTVSGSLGDKIQIGKILLDGSNARIDIQGVDNQDVVIRLGELDV